MMAEKDKATFVRNPGAPEEAPKAPQPEGNPPKGQQPMTRGSGSSFNSVDDATRAKHVARLKKNLVG